MKGKHTFEERKENLNRAQLRKKKFELYFDELCDFQDIYEFCDSCDFCDFRGFCDSCIF